MATRAHRETGPVALDAVSLPLTRALTIYSRRGYCVWVTHVHPVITGGRHVSGQVFEAFSDHEFVEGVVDCVTRGVFSAHIGRELLSQGDQ